MPLHVGADGKGTAPGLWRGRAPRPGTRVGGAEPPRPLEGRTECSLKLHLSLQAQETGVQSWPFTRSLFYSTSFFRALLWARCHARFCPSNAVSPEARHLPSSSSVSPCVKSRSPCLTC